MDEYIIKDRRRQLRLILIVTSSIFMFSLDYSMLNISLPSVAHYFNVTVGVVARLPLVYLLIVTSSLLGFGKLGDMKSHKTVFMIGLLLFLAGTVLCGISPTVNMLILSRALQSLGEAMFSPVGIAILTTFLPFGIKGRVLGLVALSQGLGLTLGNIAGGYINTHFVWRAIFFINVPLCIITILAAFRFLPARQPKSGDRSFDIIGSCLLFITLSTFIYVLNTVGKKGIGDPVIPGCLAASMAALTLFVLQEKRSAYPLLDLSLFRNRDFTFANVSAFLIIAMLIGTSFIAPFLMEMVRGLSVLKTGVFLMAPSLVMMLLAPLAGRLADRMGSRGLSVTGAAIETIAFVMLAFVNKDSSLLYIAVSMILLGAGAGIFMAPNSRLIMIHAPLDKQGVASGIYKICANTGSVLGIAVMPLLIMRTIKAEVKTMHIVVEQAAKSPMIISPGFRNAFIFASVICAIAVLFAVLAKDKELLENGEPIEVL